VLETLGSLQTAQVVVEILALKIANIRQLSGLISRMYDIISSGVLLHDPLLGAPNIVFIYSECASTYITNDMLTLSILKGSYCWSR
jgi:hypothetical protein